MPLRDILQKDKLDNTSSQYALDSVDTHENPVPEIRFIRSDTTTQEIIIPPSHHGGDEEYLASPRPSSSSSHRRSLNPFHRSRSPSASQVPPLPTSPRGERRLSHLLRRDRRGSSSSSINIPPDLPQIVPDIGDEQEREAQWEKRATVLGQRSPQLGSPGHSPSPSIGFGSENVRPRSRSSSHSRINDPQGDVNIQEAIRLHEVGELEQSTSMFAQLADPEGANNALSQVLYGLALRHGWGCRPDPEKAVTYLSAAASNSALVESQALEAGLKKGGAAKGELVLAIFELGNCFRNGWGVKKDAVAARQYFETAANLGDTDAMNEIAWCYLEGFGGKKDKVSDWLLGLLLVYNPPTLVSPLGIYAWVLASLLCDRSTIAGNPPCIRLILSLA
ncbi:tetratricopeptide repeat protein [Aspergillus lucknowensis]|uniref:HCP-like protein n=1 Tax=Aspergillus lucknowensis TaxID=176173 RepID=A0ABR4M020_9EURO